MSETKNKKALAEAVAEKCGLTKKDANAIVTCVFEEIKATLAADGKVDISGFGKFEVKHKDERTGINPVTKETIVIPAKNVPSFKAAKALKEEL